MPPGDDDGERATHVEGKYSRRMVAVKPPPAARLEDRGEIARGGQGVIRKMFDHNLRRYVAQKVMDPDLQHHPDERGRFLDEARITGQLDHPNIVRSTTSSRTRARPSS
jgi:serine/threonine protein kinase